MKISKVLSDFGEGGFECMDIGDSILVFLDRMKVKSREGWEVAEWNISETRVRTCEV